MNRKMILAIICMSLILLTANNCISYTLSNQTNVENNDEEPEIEWEFNLGTDSRDYGMDVIEVDDGYVVAGNYIEGEKGWIIKTDFQGNIDFDKKYGNTDTNFFRCILETNNGFIAAGTSINQADEQYDLWVVNCDDSGNEIWSNKYGYENERDFFTDFDYSNDGGYVLVGGTWAGLDFAFNPVFIKISSSGQEITKKMYDRYEEDTTEDIHIFDIDPVNEGYICAGYIQKPSLGDTDFFLIMLDENLEHVWNQTYDGGSDLDFGFSTCKTQSGGYIIVGNVYYEESGDPHTGILMVKTGQNGNVIKQRLYKGIRNHAEAFHIESCNDGTYLISGETGEYFSSDFYDLLVLKIDENLDEIWSFNYGESYDEDAARAKKTSDGGYIVVGTKMTDWSYWEPHDDDLWLLKLSIPFDYKPNQPQGTTYGAAGVEYTYSTSAVHPRGLDIQYGWDWNADSIVDEWTDFYSSGTTGYGSHSWSEQGSYLVRVISQDSHGMLSQWSNSLSVTMPKTKDIFYNNILEKIFYRLHILQHFIKI